MKAAACRFRLEVICVSPYADIFRITSYYTRRKPARHYAPYFANTGRSGGEEGIHTKHTVGLAIKRFILLYIPVGIQKHFLHSQEPLRSAFLFPHHQQSLESKELYCDTPGHNRKHLHLQYVLESAASVLINRTSANPFSLRPFESTIPGWTQFSILWHHGE